MKGNKSGNTCFAAIFNVKLVRDGETPRLGQNVNIEIEKTNEPRSERDEV